MNELSESKKTYCKKCNLSNSITGLKINKNGLCNFCDTSESPSSIANYYNAMKICKEFEKEIKNKKNTGYDCMLMLSGGKDSTFMLYKLLTEDKVKPLAFTYLSPFESVNSIKNIERIINILNVDHMFFSSHYKYKKLMKATFLFPKESIPEKILLKWPCVPCTNHFIITAYLQCLKLNIPYLLYCADPMQTFLYDYEIKKIINTMYLLDKELIHELYADQLDIIMNTPDEKLPKIIFPYSTWLNRYNPEKIIDELKSKSLYEGSPITTHCSFFSLLNYYSFKRYEAAYYSIELSFEVRKGIINRDFIIKLLEDFEKIFYQNMNKNGKLDPDQQNQLKELLNRLYPSSIENQEYLYNNFIQLNSIAEKINLKISDI